MKPKHRIQLVGAACGIGAPDFRCAEAPHRIRDYLAARHRGPEPWFWRDIIEAPTRRHIAADVHAFDRKLAATVAAVVSDESRFIVIGGDHSCAVGTWRGACAAMAPRGPLGLIWIDAHLDAHNILSSPTGNRHGMPLSVLLDGGPNTLFAASGQNQPPFAPQHVCLIGAHSFEDAEQRFLARLGVRVYSMNEIRARGFTTVLEDALRRVQRGTVGFGMSLDLDAIDPAEVEAVTTPVPGGLRGAEVIDALRLLVRRNALVGVEIAEYNPHRDRGGRTAALIAQLIGIVAEAAFVSAPAVALEQRYCARNYASLPVVLTRGKGVYVWDNAGRRYIDMMSAYSAVGLGHAHPRLIKTLSRQARRLSLVSRAYYSDQLGPLAQRLCELTGFARMLPMNTGAEAVETALKAARKWAYKVKGVPEHKAEIIHCAGNFHGRTIAIVGMSSDAQYRDGFGPFPAGFVQIPYGDSTALARAITPDTAAFLVEPIQGEGGIIVPPAGYLSECARLCRQHNVLLLCDEVQTGLGRTGELLACQHENVMPDGLMLGKALSGGLIPISAFLAREELMEVFTPGDHGSTFGGNPLACAVALETLNLLVEQNLVEHAAEMGDYLMRRLVVLRGPLVRAVRGRGLFVGVELDARRLDARVLSEILLRHGVLTKDTHETVLRFAPPLIINRAQIDEAVVLIERAFAEAEATGGDFPDTQPKALPVINLRD